MFKMPRKKSGVTKKRKAVAGCNTSGKKRFSSERYRYAVALFKNSGKKMTPSRKKEAMCYAWGNEKYTLI